MRHLCVVDRPGERAVALVSFESFWDLPKDISGLVVAKTDRAEGESNQGLSPVLLAERPDLRDSFVRSSARRRGQSYRDYY